MTADALQRSVAFFRPQVESWPVPDLVPRLARLLSAGEPVSVERVATAGGWTSRRMAGSPASGSPCTPPRTASPSTARPCTGSAPALEFPVLLDRPGRIESTCPVTGRPSRVEVTPAKCSPSTRRRLWCPRCAPPRPSPTSASTAIWGTSSAHRGPPPTGWPATPDGQVTTVADDFIIIRRSLIEVGWVTP